MGVSKEAIALSIMESLSLFVINNSCYKRSPVIFLVALDCTVSSSQCAQGLFLVRVVCATPASGR